MQVFNDPKKPKRLHDWYPGYIDEISDLWGDDECDTEVALAILFGSAFISQALNNLSDSINLLNSEQNHSGIRLD